MSVFGKLDSALGWARRRLLDVATVGPLLKGLLGIRDKTAAGKIIDGAQKAEGVAVAIEAAVEREKGEGKNPSP